jgi:hypothetical protein
MGHARCPFSPQSNVLAAVAGGLAGGLALGSGAADATGTTGAGGADEAAGAVIVPSPFSLHAAHAAKSANPNTTAPTRFAFLVFNRDLRAQHTPDPSVSRRLV